jgi:hypothetical protein
MSARIVMRRVERAGIPSVTWRSIRPKLVRR